MFAEGALRLQRSVSVALDFFQNIDELYGTEEEEFDVVTDSTLEMTVLVVTFDGDVGLGASQSGDERLYHRCLQGCGAWSCLGLTDSLTGRITATRALARLTTTLLPPFPKRLD